MEKNVYLNEERYHKTKKKISKISLIILIVGFLVGGSLIATGVLKQSEINSKYSEENKAKLMAELEDEKQNLIDSKAALENKIKPVEDQIKNLEREKFTGFDDAYYDRKDKIEELEESIASDKNSINVIDKALDESFKHCLFDEAKNNLYTSKYCSLKNQIDDLDVSKKVYESDAYIPFYMFGGFVIAASCMIAGSIYMVTKRREMLAFSAQQIMPIAKEGIQTMAPTIGKAQATIAKEMAPVYGDIAKEISKGIKEGLNNNDEEK